VAALLAAARKRFSLAAAMAPGLAGGGLLVWFASMRDALVDAVPGSELRAEGDEMLAITLGVVALAAAVRHLLDGGVERLRSYSPEIPRPALVAAAAVALVVALVAVDPVQRWDDFEDPGALAQPPSDQSASLEAASASAAGNGRYQWWSASLEGWAENPLTGLGAGNWELYWNANGTLPVFTLHAHSLFFEVFAELGILGLLAVLAFFGAAIVAGVGRRRSSRGEVAVWLGLLAAGLVSALGEWTWHIPAATVPLVIAAAVLTGPATLRPEWPRPVRGAEVADADEPRRPPGFGLGVATMLAGFACIWIAGVSLLSTVQLDEARSAVAAGDYEEAARNARYAGAIEPWAPEPRIELAGAEVLRGRLHEAREAAEDAVDRAPGDYRTHVVLARILAREGDQEAAEAELARANSLAPLPLPITLPPPD
jgi:tetratricopeptide (TPR) repeat protein